MGAFGYRDHFPHKSLGDSQNNLYRRRTIFTRKQLDSLKKVYEATPYPNPKLMKEIALQMDLNPKVLQIWFKNQRAKRKRVKCDTQQKQHQQSPQVQHQQSPQVQCQHSLHSGVNTSPSQSKENIPLGAPTSILPVAQIYTNDEMPSFQLSVYPDLKDYKYPPGGHKIVHFGCCQDPAIYWLQPILWSPKYLSFNHFISLPTKTEKEARNNSNS
ncbi:divergent paired-related homeobox [Microtus ochrogaster]|uniref:Divergent paired-related homeobox n=1 Tax=Microtus ochrogaster TaxID=79684 RepID=A0ABM1TW27_MICOH|nr:divergent paired-related homeobox [Microtus ochrogaster]